MILSLVEEKSKNSQIFTSLHIFDIILLVQNVLGYFLKSIKEMKTMPYIYQIMQSPLPVELPRGFFVDRSSYQECFSSRVKDIRCTKKKKDVDVSLGISISKVCTWLNLD